MLIARLQVVPLTLSPPCVVREITARKLAAWGKKRAKHAKVGTSDKAREFDLSQPSDFLCKFSI